MSVCELCDRGGVLTRHHLVPKKEHKKIVHLKTKTKQELNKSVAYFCLACHKQIHALFSEKDLAITFNTVESLLANEQVKKWVKFIGNKPEDFLPKTKRHW